MTPDVVQAQALPNYELIVTFADGAKRHFSMLPYLQYPAYQAIQPPQKFALAHVANGTVAWHDDIDISPDTLYIAGKSVNH